VIPAKLNRDNAMWDLKQALIQKVGWKANFGKYYSQLQIFLKKNTQATLLLKIPEELRNLSRNIFLLPQFSYLKMTLKRYTVLNSKVSW
jgi:hypothetical protein